MTSVFEASPTSFICIIGLEIKLQMIKITGQSFNSRQLNLFNVFSILCTLRSFSGCDVCLLLSAFLFSRVSFLILLFSKRV